MPQKVGRWQFGLSLQELLTGWFSPDVGQLSTCRLTVHRFCRIIQNFALDLAQELGTKARNSNEVTGKPTATSCLWRPIRSAVGVRANCYGLVCPGTYLQIGSFIHELRSRKQIICRNDMHDEAARSNPLKRFTLFPILFSLGGPPPTWIMKTPLPLCTP